MQRVNYNLDSTYIHQSEEGYCFGDVWKLPDQSLVGIVRDTNSKRNRCQSDPKGTKKLFLGVYLPEFNGFGYLKLPKSTSRFYPVFGVARKRLASDSFVGDYEGIWDLGDPSTQTVSHIDHLIRESVDGDKSLDLDSAEGLGPLLTAQYFSRASEIIANFDLQRSNPNTSTFRISLP